ncbi:sensor histidine kinase [Rhodopila sp.]|uniref:sensor histidine kinase n=1 Tax=Rhodopila sp. TaxID=2480087 RepID=UPI003D1086B2
MPLTGFSEPGDPTSERISGGRSAHWLVPVLYAFSAVAFVFDLCRDNTLAYGIIYAPLIATAVFHKNRFSLWILSSIACTLVVVGAFFPVLESDLPDMVGNRVLSILAIAVTAFFVHHARGIQDRLAAETRRAEAAERIKTEVLTNLSQEIRTPLHSLLGVLSLTMASKPDQRQALQQVRNDGKQLLATIDNLLDLTQIEERKLRQQTIDVVKIARDAADNARPAADQRQVNIALDPHRDPDKASAIGDSWAIRRILDNLLANAVRLTPPGGTVSLSVARSAGTVTTSVSDTGKGLSPEVALDFRDNETRTDGCALPEAGATGLALSRRLARAMNGRMTASNLPGSGATVSLSLPAADQQIA